MLTELLHRPTAAIIPRKLLLSFSDQQILTGIGIQSVALAKINVMIPYHFFLIWMLSSISTATHSAALLALFNDFKRDWILRWLRQFLMFVNLLLSIVMGVYVLKDVTTNLAGTLAIQCVWTDGAEAAPTSRKDTVLSIVGTIGVMVGNAIVFAMAVWYLHSGTQAWLRIMRIISLIFLAVIGIGAAVRVILLSQAFGHPSVNLSDSAEKDWSFGQLLPLLLLLLPIMSAIEIFRGEVKVAPPVADDQKPLYKTRQEERNWNEAHEFQPNPFWNSSQVRIGGKR